MKIKIPVYLLAFSVAAFAALAAAPCAHAAVVTYTNPATYSAASTGNTTYSFPNTGGPNDTVASPYTFGPLTFTDGGSFILYNDDAYGAGVGYLGAPGAETVTLNGATALSFNLGTFNGANTITLTINGTVAGTFATTSGFGTQIFAGVTSTTPITSVGLALPTIPGTSSELDLINFQVGAVVPEPSTWALLGLGGVELLGVTLRSRSQAAI